jgi:hypothetical protein
MASMDNHTNNKPDKPEGNSIFEKVNTELLERYKQAHTEAVRAGSLTGFSLTLAPQLFWLPREVIAQFVSSDARAGMEAIYRIPPPTECLNAFLAAKSGTSPMTNAGSIESYQALASYLGGMIMSFPSESYGFEAALALAHVDDQLVPLVISMLLSRSTEEWPEEQVLPLLQRVNSPGTTKVLETLALRCVLPHVRIPAILTIAERDASRAQHVKEQVWGSLDDGSREWLEEDLAHILDRASSLSENQSSSIAGSEPPAPFGYQIGAMEDFRAAFNDYHLDAFRQAVVRGAFSSVRGDFNSDVFRDLTARLGMRTLVENLGQLLSGVSATPHLAPFERVQSAEGEMLVREVVPR